MREPLYKYPECRPTNKGREYIGKVSKMESGKECLRWDTQPNGTPDDFLENVTYSDHFPNLDTWSHNNYCRNPSGRERPWCFVTDEDVEWEYCDIPMCTDTDPPECKITQQGGEYVGRKNVSHSGFACKPWGEPWMSNFTGIVDFSPGFPDYKGTEETHNFCRNPDGKVAPWCFIENEYFDSEFCDIPFCEIQEVQVGPEGNVEKPWCFVSDPDIEWEYCEIPFCHNLGASLDSIVVKMADSQLERKSPECKLTRSGGEYVGRRNATISGFPCQHWLARFPRDSSSITASLSAFSDEVDGSHNFCRNPDARGHGPWCFSYNEHEWEYCDVPFCPGTEGERCDIRVSGNCISGSSLFVFLTFLRPLSTIFPAIVKHHSINGLTYLLPFPSYLILCITFCHCFLLNQVHWSARKTKEETSIWERRMLRNPSWMSVLPNDISRAAQYLKFESFPDDLHPSHNFCRNPDAQSGGPWCYNGAGTDPEWEECNIKIC
ncbi:unnamed protein product [Darwinula stevensoni]|uniref:Kringle domain-containing protein n=1 Tax=Darwinula stevensoni TaxID=69355 RepID=A0A7R9AFN5_9CRUS|nr:unnamed protein product [Darwinula stevensoni]CAG0903228.1 unnamed protein product [Darwinula stevensoni]